MTPKVLSSQQIEQFITRGWTKIEAAIPPAQARKVQDFLWDKLALRGIASYDRSTWRKPMEFISENYNGSPFDECATTKLDQAISDIMGSGRWMAEGEIGWWGWWPINFAVGADQTWDVPADEWHIDCPDSGTYPTAPDQGLLVICLFSEIAPRGGGTLLLEGSHQVVMRMLQEKSGMTQNQANEALRSGEPYLRALCGRDGSSAPLTDTSNHRHAHAGELVASPDASDGDRTTERIAQFMDETVTDEHGTELRVVEVTGSPGDVFLAHPFMMHSPSFNHSGVPRFMCNRKTPMFEPLQTQRDDGDYSPLEVIARRVLKSDHETTKLN